MRLKELRQKNRLTQSQVAQILKTSAVNYNRYEKGIVQIDIQSLIKLADYYNVSLDYLLEHTVRENIDLSSFSDTQKGCIFLIEKLNEANATILLGYTTRLLQEQNKERSN